MITSRVTLIYDGDCGFCTASVNWFKARTKANIDIFPLQAINPSDYGLTPADVQREAWWITDGHHYGGHRAVAQALKACRSPWPLVGSILDMVPFRWISRLGYQWIARNRGRMPGALPTCRKEEPSSDTVQKHG